MNVFDEVVKRAREGRSVKVPDLAEASGFSRNALYQAIKREELRSIRLGRATVIPAPDALRLLGINPETMAA
jgi:predicted DNA-binding transcriptional regulator AlpA